MELKDFLGKHYLSGIEFGKAKKTEFDCSEPNKCDFILDEITYSAIEDTCDGYRSLMKEIKESKIEIKNTFIPVEVVGTLRISDYYQHEVIDFIDSITGKIVLSIGTSKVDDYYPMFVAQWMPENLCHNA